MYEFVRAAGACLQECILEILCEEHPDWDIHDFGYYTQNDSIVAACIVDIGVVPRGFHFTIPNPCNQRVRIDITRTTNTLSLTHYDGGWVRPLLWEDVKVALNMNGMKMPRKINNDYGWEIDPVYVVSFYPANKHLTIPIGTDKESPSGRRVILQYTVPVWDPDCFTYLARCAVKVLNYLTAPELLPYND